MPRKQGSQVQPSGWIAFCGLVETLLDRFGWPGALLLYFVYFVEWHASPAQKLAIVDMYVLGRGIGLQYPLFIMGAVFVTAWLAQRFYYRKKLKHMGDELKRLGEWKTKHQEQVVGSALHHSENPEE